MGIFDKLTKIAERAADAVVKTSDKIAQTYEEKGFDGIVNKTTDSINKATKETQSYFKNISEENKKIMDSIADKNLEGTIAKVAAVVINTTETLAKDAVKATIKTVDDVSKNMNSFAEEKNNMAQKTTQPTQTETTTEKKTITKKTVTQKELFLNAGETAELDCMPVEIVLKQLGAKINEDNTPNKFLLNDNTFQTKQQKWINFNKNVGGLGSISLMKHIIRLENDSLHDESYQIDKETYKSSLNKLNEIYQSKQYQKDLSDWIKEQNVVTAVIKKPVKEKTPLAKNKTSVVTKTVKKTNPVKTVGKSLNLAKKTTDAKPTKQTKETKNPSTVKISPIKKQLKKPIDELSTATKSKTTKKMKP